MFIEDIAKKNPDIHRQDCGQYSLSHSFSGAKLGSRRWRINFSPNPFELKIPLSQDFSCGQYWARTSDPYLVEVVL
jgi:hypothetical protein